MYLGVCDWLMRFKIIQSVSSTPFVLGSLFLLSYPRADLASCHKGVETGDVLAASAARNPFSAIATTLINETRILTGNSDRNVSFVGILW